MDIWDWVEEMQRHIVKKDCEINGNSAGQWQFYQPIRSGGRDNPADHIYNVFRCYR